MEYTTNYSSPLGEITLACKDNSLTGLWFVGQKHYCASLANHIINNDTEVFKQARRWLNEYFAGEKPANEQLPLLPCGSEFQHAVWNILLTIPYGQVMTYGQIAKRLADSKEIRSMSAQAVGGAIGRNPISVIIPCHRVVGAGRNLTGYAGGINRKIELLRLEGIDISQYKLPKEDYYGME